MLSRVAVCDADSFKIWLVNTTAWAIDISMKGISGALLIPIHSSAHLAVADYSLCGEGDRAATNVHCLCTELSPPSSHLA